MLHILGWKSAKTINGVTRKKEKKVKKKKKKRKEGAAYIHVNGCMPYCILYTIINISLTQQELKFDEKENMHQQLGEQFHGLYGRHKSIRGFLLFLGMLVSDHQHC